MKSKPYQILIEEELQIYKSLRIYLEQLHVPIRKKMESFRERLNRLGKKTRRLRTRFKTLRIGVENLEND